jgi:hypothetical protein
MDVGRSSRMLSVAVKEGNGRGRSIESFLITAEVPGRYTLATSVDGHEVRERVKLRAGHTTHANLIARIK